MTLWFDNFETPLGDMTVAVTETDAICLLDFSDCEGRSEQLLKRRFGYFERAHRKNPQGIRERLGDYFKGESSETAFQDLQLDFGGTTFQQKVWRALGQIAHGQTISYTQLAARISSPRAVRAAGSANGANPIAIVIPCHRVIGRDGKLAGYAGGLTRKRQLLALEQPS